MSSGDDKPPGEEWRTDADDGNEKTGVDESSMLPTPPSENVSEAGSQLEAEKEREPKPNKSPKEDEILVACQRRDIRALQTLAESQGGFMTDELRQKAWPVLLGLPLRIGDQDLDTDAEDFSWKTLPAHKDEDQVSLDVERAFVYYPSYESDQELAHQKDLLSNLIVSVLRRHPYLHYFQGYHDIAQVFLLVLPTVLLPPTLTRLSLLRIRDFMLPNLQPAISQLRLLPALLRAADPPLWSHLAHTEPFFALSGTLTMYAHDIRSLGEITRLFDALLAREPVFSVYLFAQIVRNRRAELFDTPRDEPEMLHSILSKLPHPLDLDALIADTAHLLATHPPESLGPPWTRGISEHSVLKTARETAACAGQSEAVGAYFYAQHVLELQRAERRARVLRALASYRRPAGAVGAAILVGVLAYWLRRSASSSPAASSFLVAAEVWGKQCSVAVGRWVTKQLGL